VLGARPDLNRNRVSPHAHSDAPNEDACKTIGSAAARIPSAKRRRSLLFATLDLPELTSNGEVEGPHEA